MEKTPPPPYSVQQPGFVSPQGGYAPPPQGGYAPPPQGGYAPPPQAGYVPPPQGYPPPPQQANVVITPMAVFGPDSMSTTCPYCHHQTTTRVESEAATKTHLFALILCLFGCIPCCLIPYCVDSCQNRNHYCSSCGAFLGAYTN